MARSWDEMITIARVVNKDQTWGETIAYVRGYILALEDIVKDIDKVRAATLDEGQNLLLFMVQNGVLATWDEAKKTEKTILELSQEIAEAPIVDLTEE